MNKKVWFALLKHPVPYEMEEYLEKMEEEGYSLMPLSDKSLFYYEFTECMSRKSIYIVDKSNLPKTMYMQGMLDREWEFIGNSGDCVIWRKIYEGERPKYDGDKYAVGLHCRKMGIIFCIAAVIAILAACALIAGFTYEQTHGAEVKRYSYFVEAFFQLPLFFYCAIVARKFFEAYQKLCKKKR